MKKNYLLKASVMLVFVFSMLSASVYAQTDIKATPEVSEEATEGPLVYKLANGLTVILYEEHTNPEVLGMVVTRAGGKNDRKDATGMAHYMEHMLFKGTNELGTSNWEKEQVHIKNIYALYDTLGVTTDPEKRKEIQQRINEESVKANEYAIPNELDNVLKSMGCTSLNAGTGPDQTVYYNVLPPNQIEKWLDVYSHRFKEPVFRSFQAELEVVYEEKNMYSDMFFMTLFEEYNKHFFKNHPYGQQPLIGTIDHLKNPSLTKMQEFYDKWYVANNMALVLVGDFETEKVIPMIEEKFGLWETGDDIDQPSWEEKPFKGREFIEANLSPIKMGAAGFRIPENYHKDSYALQIYAQILNNSAGTGLLDQLVLNNEVMVANLMNVQYADHGESILLFIPKILGQKLEEAEAIVLEQLKKANNGEFSDELFEAVKLNMLKQYKLSMENNMTIANTLSSAFISNVDYNEALDAADMIKSLTREDIIKVGKKYYGENFLVLHSKMGSANKPKIEKPGFEPVVQKNTEISAYQKYLRTLPVGEAEFNFVDFEKDMAEYSFKNGNKLYRVENPLNDIFSLTIKYGLGEHVEPLMQYASQLMGMSGTTNKETNDFKIEMFSLGVDYSIFSDDSYLYIVMNGPEKSFEPALALMNELLQSPKIDQAKLQTIVSGERANRKLETSEPDQVSQALLEYVIYGDKSSYLDRLTIKEIKALNVDSLAAIITSATAYKAEFHYVGKESIETVASLINETITMPKVVKPTTSPVMRERVPVTDNKVYYVHMKKSLQSKIYFYAPSNTYNPLDVPMMMAFNAYFGGGFSGLVLQEIREYRSMAYTAAASFSTPSVAGHPINFVGYVGTQADKTNHAIDIFMNLVDSMPDKSERAATIQEYLVSSALTSRPSFRGMSQSIVTWERKGYQKDPAELRVEKLSQMTYDEIRAFYEQYLKGKDMVIILVGNKKRFDVKDLEQYGEIIRVKQKRLYR